MNTSLTRDPMSGHSQCEHWNSVAEQWRHWAPPLRPCADDLQQMENLLRRWQSARPAAATRALLWGVTPEIALMRWPAGTTVTAIDRSPEMIQVIWPGDCPGVRRAICADWLDYAPPAEQFHAVIGDGVLTLLRYPAEYRSLAAQAYRSLQSDGILITRLFVMPAERESPQSVFDDLRRHCIGNFHIFKFRLAMALQVSAAEGVLMREVFDAWHAADVDREQLVARGWSADSIATINTYRQKDARLSFPTLQEFLSIFEEFFELLDCTFPSYEFGERCPVVCCRRRRDNEVRK